MCVYMCVYVCVYIFVLGVYTCIYMCVCINIYIYDTYVLLLFVHYLHLLSFCFLFHCFDYCFLFSFGLFRHNTIRSEQYSIERCSDCCVEFEWLVIAVLQYARK